MVAEKPICTHGTRRRAIGAARRPPEGAEGLSSDGGNHDVLPAVHFIRGWGCISGRGELGLPEDLARRLAQPAKDLVIAGGDDEQRSVRSHHRAAVVLATGAGQSLRGKFRILPEGNLPHGFTAIQINCG